MAYGVFLAVAQLFLLKPNNVRSHSSLSITSNSYPQYGLGSPLAIKQFADVFPSDGSLAFIWVDATAQNVSTSPTPRDIITSITRDFTPRQLSAVRQVASKDEVPPACPQNFNLVSECYAAIVFDSIPASSNDTDNTVRYTIRADGGLFYINVVKHTSDVEQRILPIQWAVDRVCIYSSHLDSTQAILLGDYIFENWCRSTYATRMAIHTRDE